ncbi:MAG TPA: glycosyltransferase family 4 protein [Patescibacteria group bacterium]|nr:glycosyltransferase family 4 protein [Patescibacteria group bacterium]
MKIAFVNFSPLTYDVQTPYDEPLGGSESSLCYLSEQLAKNGHDVTLFVHQDRRFVKRGVKHEFIENLLSIDLDFLVIQNTPYYGLKLRPLLAKKTKLIFWTGHHTSEPPVACLADPKRWQVYDQLVFVSHWQLQEYMETFRLDPRQCRVIGNAISPAFENLSPKKRPAPVLAYTSTPFRGLQILLTLFPVIRHLIPNASLEVYSDMQVYQVPAKKDQKLYGHLYQQCQTLAGVKYFGTLSQTLLAQKLQKVSLLAYPNTFAETSCIAVMEALAAGCLVVTSHLGALPETTAGFANLITGVPSGKPYGQNFVTSVVRALKQNQSPLLAQQIAYVNQHYTWSLRAGEWESLLSGLNEKKHVR